MGKKKKNKNKKHKKKQAPKNPTSQLIATLPSQQSTPPYSPKDPGLQTLTTSLSRNDHSIKQEVKLSQNTSTDRIYSNKVQEVDRELDSPLRSTVGIRLPSQSTISFIETLHGKAYQKAIFEFSE